MQNCILIKGKNLKGCDDYLANKYLISALNKDYGYFNIFYNKQKCLKFSNNNNAVNIGDQRLER